MRGFEQIVPGVSLLKVPFHDGSYDTGVALVREGGLNILIDSGECGQTVDSCILPALAESNVEKLHWLLCTHSHGDHIGGHGRLVEKLAPRTAAYALDAPNLPVRADVLLEDSDSRIPGLKLIPIPGHMPGAVGWLHEKTSTLICGDSLQGAGTDGVGLALVENIPAYRDSIARLAAMPLHRLVCGHGFAPCDFVIERPLRVRAFLQCCLDTVERYECFVRRQGTEDVAAISEKLTAAEGRTLRDYIVRGDSTVAGILKAEKKTDGPGGRIARAAACQKGI